MRRFNIFVIEDDDVDFMNVERSLQKINIINPIIRAKDGAEAWQILTSGEIEHPIIIFLDLSMPQMGGHEFLKLLRSHPEYNKVPVIVMTVSTEESDKDTAYDTGIQGYVIKPLQFDDFVDILKTINAYWSICEVPNDRK
tara:strand:+ start:61230 stop:61649 length:420 start_codon:yes stop_codon:yes gene_type:complete